MIIEIRKMTAEVRKQILTISARARAPHIASALSCTDILTALYFNVATIYPENPKHPYRDRIILSKGHAAAALYSCLALKGFFPRETLDSFAQDGSVFAEHPSYRVIPGVECSTGSLGHGLGIGSGIALKLKMDGSTSRVFVVLSDGECNEGSTWEAALWAPKQQLSNLIGIVDYNKLQATGPSNEITQLEPLADKWKSYGWDVVEIDGHNLDDLTRELEQHSKEKRRMIIAHTIKGRGVSFMENDLEWHYKPLDDNTLPLALKEIEETQ